MRHYEAHRRLQAAHAETLTNPDPMPPITQFKHTLSRALAHSRAHEKLPLMANVVPMTEVDLLAPNPRTKVRFCCNLCGLHNTVRFEQIERETPSCVACGSTVRFRAIVDLLMDALFGQDLRLDEVPVRRDIRGLGLSDAEAYAVPLAKKFDYLNTYYHMDPRLDIANAPQSMAGKYDFLIASDVFEHVAPPVSKAFVNAWRLLKPGGVFIFTVPFSMDGPTVEHYPELNEFTIVDENGRWTLHNRTVDGRHQTFTDLVFHGGPGSTLEMRMFSLEALQHEFHKAGFKSVRVASEPCLLHGIHWPEPYSVPIVARA